MLNTIAAGRGCGSHERGRAAVVMSLYLQQLRGVSSLGAGLAFLPMMLIGAALTRSALASPNTSAPEC